MTPMNPDSARALIWAALILNILAVTVLAPEAQFAFSVLAAVFALVPSVLARGQAGLGARFVLALSLALVYAGYPKFEQSPYMQRLSAASGQPLASVESDAKLHAAASGSEDTRVYRALFDPVEEVYGMGLADDKLTRNWTDTGKRGSRTEIVAWIDVVWPEYQRRPLSLRKKMEELGIEDTRVYQVLIDEGTGRYYAYPLEKGVPTGFKSAGITGSLSDMDKWVWEH